jgi:hypothetical protein
MRRVFLLCLIFFVFSFSIFGNEIEKIKKTIKQYEKCLNEYNFDDLRNIMDEQCLFQLSMIKSLLESYKEQGVLTRRTIYVGEIKNFNDLVTVNAKTIFEYYGDNKEQVAVLNVFNIPTESVITLRKKESWIIVSDIPVNYY